MIPVSIFKLGGLGQTTSMCYQQIGTVLELHFLTFLLLDQVACSRQRYFVVANVCVSRPGGCTVAVLHSTDHSTTGRLPNKVVLGVNVTWLI